MDIRSALKGQYHAALKTLRLVIEECPERMWNEASDGAAPVWRVVYHTLYYSHFYLQQDHRGYAPWLGHCEGAQRLDNVPCLALNRREMLAFWAWCDEAVDRGIEQLDLNARQCGFPWYRMPTLEHQIANIRHIQNHAAALAMRLRQTAHIEIAWVGGADGEDGAIRRASAFAQSGLAEISRSAVSKNVRPASPVAD